MRTFGDPVLYGRDGGMTLTSNGTPAGSAEPAEIDTSKATLTSQVWLGVGRKPG
jgi:hypothetical protein